MHNLAHRIVAIPFNNHAYRLKLLTQLWQQCGNSEEITPEQERFLTEIEQTLGTLKRDQEEAQMAASRRKREPWRCW